MLTKPSLKNVPIDARNYIRYLELENKKLKLQIAKLQVANLSILNEKKAVQKLLAKETKELENIIKPPDSISVELIHKYPPLE